MLQTYPILAEYNNDRNDEFLWLSLHARCRVLLTPKFTPVEDCSPKG